MSTEIVSVQPVDTKDQQSKEQTFGRRMAIIAQEAKEQTFGQRMAIIAQEAREKQDLQIKKELEKAVPVLLRQVEAAASNGQTVVRIREEELPKNLRPIDLECRLEREGLEVERYLGSYIYVSPYPERKVVPNFFPSRNVK